MLVVLSPIFVADTKIIFGYNFVAPLNKNQIIDLFLKIQEQTNPTIASLTPEIKRLNENFQKLESGVSVIKNVNNILSKQISSM